MRERERDTEREKDRKERERETERNTARKRELERQKESERQRERKKERKKNNAGPYRLMGKRGTWVPQGTFWDLLGFYRHVKHGRNDFENGVQLGGICLSSSAEFSLGSNQSRSDSALTSCMIRLNNPLPPPPPTSRVSHFQTHLTFSSQDKEKYEK